ncbi:SNF1-related protein kinase regulatory subunit beta-1 [Bienertia sinuspersici]
MMALCFVKMCGKRGLELLIASRERNSYSDHMESWKILRKSGKDHAVLLVLPPGIYHYRFIVDGETRYTPDLPHVSSEMGLVCNVLNADVSITFDFVSECY